MANKFRCQKCGRTHCVNEELFSMIYSRVGDADFALKLVQSICALQTQLEEKCQEAEEMSEKIGLIVSMMAVKAMEFKQMYEEMLRDKDEEIRYYKFR